MAVPLPRPPGAPHFDLSPLDLYLISIDVRFHRYNPSKLTLNGYDSRNITVQRPKMNREICPDFLAESICFGENRRWRIDVSNWDRMVVMMLHFTSLSPGALAESQETSDRASGSLLAR